MILKKLQPVGAFQLAEKTIKIRFCQGEKADLGFYGFQNPKKIFLDFRILNFCFIIIHSNGGFPLLEQRSIITSHINLMKSVALSHSQVLHFTRYLTSKLLNVHIKASQNADTLAFLMYTFSQGVLPAINRLLLSFLSHRYVKKNYGQYGLNKKVVTGRCRQKNRYQDILTTKKSVDRVDKLTFKYSKVIRRCQLLDKRVELIVLKYQTIFRQETERDFSLGCRNFIS